MSSVLVTKKPTPEFCRTGKHTQLFNWYSHWRWDKPRGIYITQKGSVSDFCILSNGELAKNQTGSTFSFTHLLALKPKGEVI